MGIDNMYKESLKKTINMIKEYTKDIDGVSLMFSGGRDSVVLYHILKTYFENLKVDLITVTTGMEFDNWYEFMQIHYPETIYIDTNVFESWKQYNRLPDIQNKICCYEQRKIIKSYKLKYNRVVLQGKKSKDKFRTHLHIEPVKRYKNGGVRIQPLIDWSQEEINAYIKEFDLKYCDTIMWCTLCFYLNRPYEVKMERLNNNPKLAERFYSTVHSIYTNNPELQKEYETEEKYINWFLNCKQRIVNK